MFCHKCGTQVADGAEFCHKCGTRLTTGKPSAPEPAPNAQTPTQPYPQQTGTSNPSVQVSQQPYASPVFPQKNKSKAPQIILGILGGIFGLFVLLIIIGIVAGSDETDISQDSSSSQTNVNLSQTYVSEEDGVSFKYPSEWVPVEDYDEYVNAGDGKTLLVLLNETENLPENTTCIILQRYPVAPGDEADLAKSEEDFLDELQDEPFTVKEAPVIELSGMPCRKLTAVDENGDGYTI